MGLEIDGHRHESSKAPDASTPKPGVANDKIPDKVVHEALSDKEFYGFENIPASHTGTKFLPASLAYTAAKIASWLPTGSPLQHLFKGEFSIAKERFVENAKRIYGLNKNTNKAEVKNSEVDSLSPNERAQKLGEHLAEFNKKNNWYENGKDILFRKFQEANNPNNTPEVKKAAQASYDEVVAFLGSGEKPVINETTGLPEFRKTASKPASPQEVSRALSKLAAECEEQAAHGNFNYKVSGNNVAAVSSELLKFSESRLGASAMKLSSEVRNQVSRAVTRQDLVVIKDSSENVLRALEETNEALVIMIDFLKDDDQSQVFIDKEKGKEEASALITRLKKGLQEHRDYGIKLSEKPHTIGSEDKLARAQQMERIKQMQGVASKKNDVNDLFKGLSKMMGKKLLFNPAFQNLQKDLEEALERNGGANLVDISGKGYVDEVAPLINRMAAFIGR